MSNKRKGGEIINHLNKTLKPTQLHPFFNFNNKVDRKGNNLTIPDHQIIWGAEGLKIPPPSSLLIGRTYNFKWDRISWVLGLDLDGTLIKVKGNHVYPKSADDWQWHNAKVVETLKHHVDLGAGLVILSNQSGLDLAKLNSKREIKLEEFKTKVQQIAQQLKLPFILLVATQNDRYRKPRVGMWEYFERVGGRSLDREKSIYVGDAAGRLATTIPQRKKDFSDTDKKLALNLGLKFFTPEEFFLAQPQQAYTLNGFDAKAYLEAMKGELPQTKLDIQPLNKGKLELVLMVGLPGSGKTSTYERYLKPHGYEWINNDTLKSKTSCLKLAQKHLSAKVSVVIDNTNLDIKTRKPYIDIAKKYEAQVRCLTFSTEPDLCKHNALYRATRSHPKLVNGKAVAVIPDLVFLSLGKRYQPPELSEGIDLIESHPFVPQFATNGDGSEPSPEDQLKEWALYYF